MALKVTQTRSAIGTKPKQRGTLRALGLGRIGRANVLPDRPEIRGMIHRVPHLVSVEEIEEGATSDQPDSGSRSDTSDGGDTKAEAAPEKAAKKASAKKAAAKKSTAKKATKSNKKAAAKKTAKKASS